MKLCLCFRGQVSINLELLAPLEKQQFIVNFKNQILFSMEVFKIMHVCKGLFELHRKAKK